MVKIFTCNQWQDSEEAVTIAAEPADKIKQLHAQYNTATVHLFAAAPLGLALFIGTI